MKVNQNGFQQFYINGQILQMKIVHQIRAEKKVEQNLQFLYHFLLITQRDIK